MQYLVSEKLSDKYLKNIYVLLSFLCCTGLL